MVIVVSHGINKLIQDKLKKVMMKYKCPQCDHASEQPGDCPVHNVPMVESPEAPQAEQPSEQTSS